MLAAPPPLVLAAGFEVADSEYRTTAADVFRGLARIEALDLSDLDGITLEFA